MSLTRRSANRFTLLWIAVFLATNSGTSQPQSTQFKAFIAERLDPTEAASLADGKLVVKIVPSADKREISVLGIVKIRRTDDIDMAFFRESLSQRSSKSMLDGGKFSTPPEVKDLELFKLETRDLEDMRRCTVGNCSVKLSAGMITAIQNEVDWNAPDSEEVANRVFKRLVAEYVRAYSERGSSALLVYADHRKPIRLADEDRILLDGSTLIKLLAPEFDNYLRKYPSGEPPGVENRLDWSNVKSGLKPILTITHGTSYSKQASEFSVHMITTKQIYASHYVDASLALSSLVRLGSGESVEFYLVFTNISRSDALGGALSSIAHAVAETEAIDKVSDIMDRAKNRLDAPRHSDATARLADENQGLFSQFADLTRNWLFVVVALFFSVMIAVFLFRRWRG